MAKLTRKRFLALGAATTASVALGVACTGGDGGGGSGPGPGPGDDDDGYGDDDDSVGSPIPSPSTNPSPSPSPTAFGDCNANGANASAISANHGHTLSVPAADVMAGTQKTYSIQGSSPHDHLLTVTAAHFATLQTNFQVVIASGSGGGHTHSVTVRCIA